MQAAARSICAEWSAGDVCLPPNRFKIPIWSAIFRWKNSLISLSAFFGNNNQQEEENGVDLHGQVVGEDRLHSIPANMQSTTIILISATSSRAHRIRCMSELKKTISSKTLIIILLTGNSSQVGLKIPVAIYRKINQGFEILICQFKCLITACAASAIWAASVQLQDFASRSWLAAVSPFCCRVPRTRSARRVRHVVGELNREPTGLAGRWFRDRPRTRPNRVCPGLPCVV
jgi:hypothetical protein